MPLDREDGAEPFPHLVNAVDRITHLAQEMNERKRQSENRLRLVRIRESLPGMCGLIQPSRRLLKDGHLNLVKVVSENGSTRQLEQDVQVVACSDLLIVVQGQDILATFEGPVSATASWENTTDWRLITYSKEEVWYFSARPEERRAWIKAVAERY